MRNSANIIEPLSQIQEFAFAEKSYAVSDNGQIQEQIRFVSIPSMIRLTTQIAEQLDTELEIDFGVVGWADLKQAIKVRNRITHPKSISDLDISDTDIAIIQSGLLWFLGSVYIQRQHLRAATKFRKPA